MMNLMECSGVGRFVSLGGKTRRSLGEGELNGVASARVTTE